MSTQGKVLDPTKRSPQLQEFEAALRSKVVGQDEAVEALVSVFQVFCAAMNAPGRPVGNLLFLGPTGSGKTRIVEAAAEVLFGDRKAVVKIDCAEFQHSHEIAKLIGSPPGYLGHRDTHPLIAEETLSQYHTDKLKLSFLLFDEIEKASDALWQLLLGILDKATLTLGDTRRVDLSQTIIVLTSNLGAREITALVSKGMGFVEPSAQSAAGLNVKLQRTAVEAARRRFSPEFMNRLDRVVVFHQLQPEQLGEILDIELAVVQQQVLDGGRVPFMFRVMPDAKAFLLREGTDLRYGARHLKRAIARQVVSPLANLLASGQVELGDMVSIDWDSDARRLVFENQGPAPPSPVTQHPVTTFATPMAGRTHEAVAGATAS
jgi:ATP-dependent Clp protease ATP-binding subunit ClpA